MPSKNIFNYFKIYIGSPYINTNKPNSKFILIDLIISTIQHLYDIVNTAVSSGNSQFSQELITFGITILTELQIYPIS